MFRKCGDNQGPDQRRRSRKTFLFLRAEGDLREAKVVYLVVLEEFKFSRAA